MHFDKQIVDLYKQNLISDMDYDFYFGLKEKFLNHHSKFYYLSKQIQSGNYFEFDSTPYLPSLENNLFGKRSHGNFFTEKELQKLFKERPHSSFGEGFKIREYFRKTFDEYNSLQFVDLE